MNCKEFNQLDIVDYLLLLGHTPAKIHGNDYWYFSPFRDEQTPSFKVNRKFNVWYDHGLQKGGKLVDFGTRLYGCTITELLNRSAQQNSFSFHQQIPVDQADSFSGAVEKEKIVVVDARHPINLLPLQDYLQYRRIPLEIANRFCKEVDFNLYDRKYTVIEFQNSAGGYELRSANFKGSSSPKEVTLFGKDLTKEILVFEGFIDFLSYKAIHQPRLILLPKQQPNFLILNSIGFLKKMKPILENYPSIHLYLDRDKKGLELTKEVLSISRKYRDESLAYKNHKDLNEYLMKEYHALSQSLQRGRRL
ncbi:MAG: toprim domain-containing protein [Sediminibacterium sp.]|nr:toprim domain-containing protein [Sediminibacterium sp.]